MIGCQALACEALAEMKVREVEVESKAVVWWRYLCAVHLDEEYGPWLRSTKK